MNKPINIYTLSCPDTLQVRYVGITKGSLKQRLRTHLWQIESTPKTVWIQKLIACNKQPVISLIEVCEDRQTAYARELEWIELFIELGHDMLNKEAYNGYPHTYLSDDDIQFIERVKKCRKTYGLMFNQYEEVI